MDFCQTRPDPSVASVKLTRSLTALFESLPPTSADLNVYSFGEAHREIVSSVRLELAALLHVKTMISEDLRTVAPPILQFCSITRKFLLPPAVLQQITCLCGLLFHGHVYP